MFHPTYAWMFFNWYLDLWWMNNSGTPGSCIKNGSVQVEDLERVLRNSLVLDHLPRIKDEYADKPNVGNIVSNIANNYAQITTKISVYSKIAILGELANLEDEVLYLRYNVSHVIILGVNLKILGRFHPSQL